MWFDRWSDLVRILLVGAAAYATLVVVLRLSGKRTLAKLNAFDFVVTVAFGSTLATIFLSKDVSWSEGAVALALLAGLQLVIAKVTAVWPAMRVAATSRPSFVVTDGEVDEAALEQHRLSRSEILQVVRGAGYGDLADVSAVVLETDGTMSVIGSDKLGDGSAMVDVQR